MNNAIELNDINKSYNSYKLIMKKKIVFHLEYTINQKSGMPCYLNVCSILKKYSSSEEWVPFKKSSLLCAHISIQ